MKAEYVDHMGSDLSVVNAARVSFDKRAIWDRDADGNKVLHPADKRLIEYLARGMSSKDFDKILENAWNAANLEDLRECFRKMQVDTHWTPFAHTSITLRMGAPVPIRTQCFKHTVGFAANEESRRYISSAPDVFIPNVFRSAPKGSIKQGSEGVHPNSEFWKTRYKIRTSEAVDEYLMMIEDGVCPEQARFILPQGVEVNWIWTGNVASFARFYRQRSNSHAQAETQILAAKVANIIAPLFPVSWKALTE